VWPQCGGALIHLFLISSVKAATERSHGTQFDRDEQGFRNETMFKRLAAISCVVLAAFVSPALAENFTISLEAGTERAAQDFSRAVLNYDILSVTRTYDGGFTWTAMAQNYRAASHGPVTWAAEGLVGYRHPLSSAFSVYGNIGAGERLSPTREFPYLATRLGADDALGNGIIWNVVNLRYRTGWDRNFPYHSTTAGTGLTYQIGEHAALYGRAFAVFDTGYRFAGTGLGIGARLFL
jgi:hypothetical protein